MGGGAFFYEGSARDNVAIPRRKIIYRFMRLVYTDEQFKLLLVYTLEDLHLFTFQTPIIYDNSAM